MSLNMFSARLPVVAFPVKGEVYLPSPESGNSTPAILPAPLPRFFYTQIIHPLALYQQDS